MRGKTLRNCYTCHLVKWKEHSLRNDLSTLWWISRKFSWNTVMWQPDRTKTPNDCEMDKLIDRHELKTVCSAVTLILLSHNSNWEKWEQITRHTNLQDQSDWGINKHAEGNRNKWRYCFKKPGWNCAYKDTINMHTHPQVNTSTIMRKKTNS